MLLDYDNVKIPLAILKIGELCLRRIAKDKDLVIAISGDEGEGKSTLSILLGVAISDIFDLEKNMIYTDERNELYEKLISMPKGSPIIPDEAIKMLYKHNWASAGQKYINMLYSLARRENKITILPIPRFTDINEFFRNHRVRVWIHIIKEGHAIMFSKDWSPFSFKDPWFIYENEKLIEKLRRRKKLASFDFSEKVRILRQCRNFVIYFKFPKLPDSIYGTYKNLSTGKYDDLKEIFKLDQKELAKIPYREAFVNALKKLEAEGHDMNAISYITKLPVPTLQHLLLPEINNIPQNSSSSS